MLCCCYCSVAQSCPTSASPWTGACQAFLFFTVSEFAQFHVHWVRDAIYSSHPLSPPSFAFSLLQYQSFPMTRLIHTHTVVEGNHHHSLWHTPHLYPFLCWWTSRLLPCLDCCEQWCSEHSGVHFNQPLIISVLLSVSVNLAALGNLHKWSHTVSVLLCPAINTGSTVCSRSMQVAGVSFHSSHERVISAVYATFRLSLPLSMDIWVVSISVLIFFKSSRLILMWK